MYFAQKGEGEGGTTAIGIRHSTFGTKKEVGLRFSAKAKAKQQPLFSANGQSPHRVGANSLRAEFEITCALLVVPVCFLGFGCLAYRFLGTSCRFFAFRSSYPRMEIMRTLQKKILIEPRGIYVTSRQLSTNRISRNERNSSSFPALASSDAYLWSRVVNELN